MDRSWMYGDRRESVYIDGVKEFCHLALEHRRITSVSTIVCPCRDCGNLKRWVDINKIMEHLFRRGFTNGYETWYWHGEKICVAESGNVIGDDEQVGNESCGDDADMGEDQINEMFNVIGDRADNDRPRMFEDVSKAAETPLYPGCRNYSKLSAVLTLANIKAKYGWTDTSFNSLLEILADMLPDGNELPTSAYYAKKLINPLGLEYTKIHACPNDCVLYRKEYENLDTCPVCGLSRYIRKESVPNGKKTNPPPAKVLRYLPIIPRFKRLFSVENDAKNLVWHEKERKKDGLVRHPADSKQWAKINEQFPAFAAEPRNLRLGLSTDGMNPYGNLSSIHSTWPVLLTIYNLPPWLCMKRKYIMLTLLISGPKQPGNDIDVYLAPLMDDLKQLWDEGVPMYDAHTGTDFTLRALLFCTINDFPAYGNLSGYKVRSEKACPVCEEDMKPLYLSFSSKNVYMHTRRFLPRFHPYRKMKAKFNGAIEMEVAREPLTGMQSYERIQNMTTVFGKGVKSKSSKDQQWKKRSILWDLPYWKHLSVRHCLDVMHIEKNVCDSIVGTLLNIPRKTKDGLKVRRDMQQLNIRPLLWPEYNETKTKAYLPRACYTMSKEEKRIFLECLYDIKVPTGYSSNIKRFVSITEKSLNGMKSHDCHVLMQVFLPIALRGILPNHVRQAIVKLCFFFEKICRKVIDPKELDKLQSDVVETLCQFEMYFPPSFFDIMVHLVIHLVREVKECGPVFLRWMYPMERYMGVLKGFMKNRARPEGSIVQRFMAEEASNFCTVFLNMAKEIGLSKSRHEGRLQGQGTIGRKEIRPPTERFQKAHRCVLQHLSEVHPYLERHVRELRARNPRIGSYALMQEHNRTFVKWFQTQVGIELKEPNNNVSPTVQSLSRGPQVFVKSFHGYDINGYSFATKIQDDKGVHQNSSIMVVASSTEYSSARDTRPIDATQIYYGVIQEIWELDYLDFKIPLFRCKWVENRHGVKVSNDGMTLVDSLRFVDTVEPFVLASLAKQIFYVKDNIDHQWLVVVQGKRKIVGVEDVFDEEDYEHFDATPPLSIGVQPLSHGEDVADDEVYDRDEGITVDMTV